MSNEDRPNLAERLAAPLVKGAKTVSEGAKTITKGTVKGVKTAFLDPTAGALDRLRPAGGGKKLDLTLGGAPRHVRNIFAKPLQGLLSLDTYKPPVHPKDTETRYLILRALRQNFVFDDLPTSDLNPMVDAFETVQVQKGHIIIQQGGVGDYFYIVQSGSCEFLVDKQHVGTAQAGSSFGELALLYTCPRAATVRANEATTLLRVDQRCFRYILKKAAEKGQSDKVKLLKGVPFLQQLAPGQLRKLGGVMVPKPFKEGDYLVKKGDICDYFYIIESGQIKATDIGDGKSEYDDVVFAKGDFFGERAIMTGKPNVANAVATTDGLAFCIDKATFEATLGKFSAVVLRAKDLHQIAAIKIIHDSKLDPKTLSALSALVRDKSYRKGEAIFKSGETVSAALYLIRAGKVEIDTGDGAKKLKAVGSYFGEEQLLMDVQEGPDRPATAVPGYTVTAMEDCSVGVLRLEDCRNILDTTYFGTPQPSMTDSLSYRDIPLKGLKRHTILGAGTFGQVWLVSLINSKGEQKPYALKVQSKYELVQDGQAKAVVYEKNIMAKLSHPFLISVFKTYQDEKCVYMVMQLVQGGELYNVIHGAGGDGMREEDAQFYTAGIAEGLSYMHRRGYIHRDLKPENVLVNSQGYPVIIDFGFAKYVEDKTFTFCGTPLYLAPEVILNRGHNWGADHWSLGVLLYEMLTGQQAFYKDNMQQMDLFKAIVKGVYVKPRGVSPQANALVKALLTRNPSQRLGSLAGGVDDILKHAWFTGLDFDQLRLQSIEAPYIPTIKNPLDASNFEDWGHLDDKTKQKYPKLTQEEEAIFADF